MKEPFVTIQLYAEFTALPGHATTVTQLLVKFMTTVRQEPGNLAFAAHHPRGADDSFFVYETYRDEDAFQRHLKSDHGVLFNVALAPLVVGGKATLTFLSPVLGSQNLGS